MKIVLTKVQADFIFDNLDALTDLITNQLDDEDYGDDLDLKKDWELELGALLGAMSAISSARGNEYKRPKVVGMRTKMNSNRINMYRLRS